MIWVILTMKEWAIIAAAMWLAIKSGNLFIMWLCTLVIGNRQHALALMGHEASHYHVCKNKRINDFVGSLFSMWPMGVGIDGYRKFHFLHHKTVGTKQDPELIHKRWASPEYDPPFRLRYLIKDFLGHGLVDVIRLIRLVRPASVKDVVGPACVILMIHMALILTGNYLVSVLWYFSMFTSFWATFRIRIWTEHQEIWAITSKYNFPWWFSMIFAPNGACYHWEHHDNTSIPGWKLHR